MGWTHLFDRSQDIMSRLRDSPRNICLYGEGRPAYRTWLAHRSVYLSQGRSASLAWRAKGISSCVTAGTCLSISQDLKKGIYTLVWHCCWRLRQHLPASFRSGCPRAGSCRVAEAAVLARACSRLQAAAQRWRVF